MTILSDNGLLDSKEQAQPVDASIQVIVSHDKLSAYLHLEPPENGGREGSLDDLKSHLMKSGVTYGVIQETLEAMAKKPVYGRDILIAQGSAPVHGTDGAYRLLFETSKAAKPKERADGTVDFHDLGLIENVQQGQVLCRITPPSNGVDGISVLCVPIPAKNGKPVPRLLGKNTQLSEDGTEIHATISGYVNFVAGKINVNDTFFIKENVDNSTGNIKTASNVVITGAVLPGFSVESEGSIQIGGTVSGSTIIASGDVVLKGGIIGGHVKCEGDLTTKFIENCDVSVSGCIRTDYIMNCSIQCAKSITASGPIAKIVGGSCVAGEDIHARVIGSSSGVRTYLEIGTDATLVARQQELIKLISEWQEKINSLKELLYLFQQCKAANRLTADKQKAFQDARYSYETCFSLLQSGKQELEDINESIKMRGYGKIVCSGTICPGTIVKIGRFKMDVQYPLINKSLHYTDEGIR